MTPFLADLGTFLKRKLDDRTGGEPIQVCEIAGGVAVRGASGLFENVQQQAPVAESFGERRSALGGELRRVQEMDVVDVSWSHRGEALEQ